MEYTLCEPIVCKPEDFPVEKELPEGCREIVLHDDELNVRLKTNIVYAEQSGMELHLHVFMPMKNMDDRTKYPLVIYITGSAWMPQDMDFTIPELCAFAKRGYTVVSVQYRPSAVAPFPAQILDVKTAMRFIRMHADEYRADVTKTVYFGASSGGHTAAFCGITGDRELVPDLYAGYSCEADAAVDWYGPTAVGIMGIRPSCLNHNTADSPEGMLCGGVNVWENQDIAEKATPMNYIPQDRKVPPMLIMHGDRDFLVPFHQSILLYNKLRETGNDVEFYKVLNASHGFNGFAGREAFDLVDEFIRRKLDIK